MAPRWSTRIALLLGALAAVLFAAVMTGLDGPFTLGGRISFITLAVIAFGICVINVLGLARFGWTSPTYWTHPASVIGVVLGVASLVIIIIAFMGVAEITGAFTVLGAIVFARVGVKIWQNAELKH